MTPAFSWYLAVRYLLARRVNALGIAGVAVAVWALIVVISVFSGFISEIRGHIRGATADLVLTGVRDDTDYASVRGVLESDPAVAATAPRLQHYAILFPQGSQRLGDRFLMVTATANSPSQLDFVTLIGVDPELERETTEFARWLRLDDEEKAPYEVHDPSRPFEISPDVFADALRRAGREHGEILSTPDGILLSHRRLTRGASGPLLGRLIDLITARFERVNGESEVIRTGRKTLAAGAFETRYRTFDSHTAFCHIEFLRDILGQSADDPFSIELISEVAIRLQPGSDLAATRARLEEAVGPICGGVVRTWEQMNQVFLDAVDHERAMMKVVLFCVMLVAGFLIYATLHMMVTQKVKDIGILTSLGATPRGIATIFLLCGGVVAFVGCSLGGVLGVVSAHRLNDVNEWLRAQFGVEIFPTDLYDLDQIPYLIEADWLLQVLASAFVLSLLVAYLPARRASRMDPVKALSYE